MNDKTDTQELRRNTNRSSKWATGGSILIILILVLILPALNFFSSLRIEKEIRYAATILQQQSSQSSQSSPPPAQSFIPWAHEKAPVGCVILSEGGRAKELSCFPLPNNEKSNWVMPGAVAPSVAPSATPAPKR